MNIRWRTALSALAVVFSASHALAQGGPPPAKVVFETVAPEVLSDYRGVTGEIRSLRRGELAAQVSGLVIELDVQEGDLVEAGGVVARLDDERARALLARAESEVLSAQAEIEQREAELAEAERDLERQKQLEERGSLNPAEMDAAQTLVASRRALLAAARADASMARADVTLARRELEDMTIEAPFTGRVVVKHTELGSWVASGDPVVTVVSMTALEARIDVPEGMLWALEENDSSVELRLAGVRGAMTASVVAVVPEADGLSRLFPVRLRVDDPDGKLRPGMSLTALVPTGREEEHLTVHKDAILRNDAGEYVYYSSGGTAAVAPITRRFAVGDRVVVRSPVLREGSRVVVDGNERLFPGQPLMELGAEPARGGGGPGGRPGDGSSGENGEG